MEDIHNTLEDCKAASLNAENMNYPSRLDFDVEYSGATYQADTKSYMEIISALSQNELPIDFYWVDKNNNKIPFDKQKLQGLANVIFLKRFSVFDGHQKRKEVMRNATAVEGLFF